MMGSEVGTSLRTCTLSFANPIPYATKKVGRDWMPYKDFLDL